ncbi:MAG TPA: right-handed parallel beta-helix repeat-containing protein, partial [bacterium]|nr:right-handed parallel beta-helix repeat-containing protein [bacterium]
MTHESLVARCSACRYTLVRIAILVSLALGIFSISPRCHGADIHVPRDHSTISAAMAAAESGDVILVAPGLYTAASGETFPIAMKAGVILAGTGGDAGVTEINADGSGANVITCWNIASDMRTQIENLTIRGGDFPPGVDIRGGGIELDDASPVIIDCVIDGNRATHGGGIECRNGSSPLVIGSVVSNNECLYNGGGVHSYNFSNPVFLACDFTGNVSGLCGGGYFGAVDSSQILVNCRLYGNAAVGGGGGLHSGNRTHTTLFNCLITGNTARAQNYGGGGGLRFLDTDAVTIIHCTIADNAADRGTEISCECSSAPILFRGCIVWNGTDPGSPSLIHDTHGVLDFIYCDVKGGVSGTGNIDTDPLFIDQPDYADAPD